MVEYAWACLARIVHVLMDFMASGLFRLISWVQDMQNFHTLSKFKIPILSKFENMHSKSRITFAKRVLSSNGFQIYKEHKWKTKKVPCGCGCQLPTENHNRQPTQLGCHNCKNSIFIIKFNKIFLIKKMYATTSLVTWLCEIF
jgi:hypothetical protein